MSADLAPQMLHKVAERAADLLLSNITTKAVDAQDLSFAKDASFDAITFSLGLQIVPDKAR